MVAFVTHLNMKFRVVLLSITLILLSFIFFNTNSYANDSQWSTGNNCGFIGAFTDISQISDTYIDLSLSEPFEVFYNKGQLSVDTIVNADTDLYLAYSIITPNILPNIISVNIPLTRAIFLTDHNFDIDSIYMLYNGSAYSTYDGQYSLDTSNYDYWLNLYNFNNSYWQSNHSRYYVIIIKVNLNDLLYISQPGVQYVSNHYSVDSDTIRFNTFQNITYPMYMMYNHITKISRYFASDSKLKAEEASQPVIDQTLEDFTGEGSASVKLIDISSAKNISNSLRSGLNSGGSVTEALSIFSTSNSFWNWFSQDCASYFDYIDPSSQWVDIPFIQEGQYKIYNTSGVPVTGNYRYENYSRSNYIDVHLFKSIKYSRINSTSNVPYALFVYDQNYNVLVTIKNITGQFWRYTEATLNLPDNAYYIGINLFDTQYITGSYLYGQYRYDTTLRRADYNPDHIPDVISGYDEEYNRYIRSNDER